MLTALDNIRQDVVQLFYSVKHRLAGSKNYYCIAINSNFMLYFCRSYEAREYNLSWLIAQLEAIVKRKPSGYAAEIQIAQEGLALANHIIAELKKMAPDNISPAQPQDIIVEPQYTLSCLYTLINSLQKAKWDFASSVQNSAIEAAINKIIDLADSTIDKDSKVATQNFGVILAAMKTCVTECKSIFPSLGMFNRAPANVLKDALDSAAKNFEEATLATTLSYSYPDLFRQVLAWLNSGLNIAGETKKNEEMTFLREVGTYKDPTEVPNPPASCRFPDESIAKPIRDILYSCPSILEETSNTNLDKKSRRALGEQLNIYLKAQQKDSADNTRLRHQIIRVQIEEGQAPAKFIRNTVIRDIKSFLEKKNFKPLSIDYLCINLHQSAMLGIFRRLSNILEDEQKWSELYKWTTIQPDVTLDAILVMITLHVMRAPMFTSFSGALQPEMCTKMEISYKLVFTDNDKRSYFDPKIIFSGPNNKKCRETFLRAIMQPSSAAASPENPGIAARSRTTSQASTNVFRPRASSSLSLRSAFATAASQTSSSAISSSAVMRPHSTPPGTQGSSAASAAASSATSGSAKTTPSPSKVALGLGNANNGVPNSVAMPSSAMPNGIERHPLPWSGQGRPPFFPLMQGVDRPLRSQRAAAPGRSPQRTPPASPGPGLGSDGSPFKPYARPQPPAVNATSSSSIAPPPKLNFDGI